MGDEADQARTDCAAENTFTLQAGDNARSIAVIAKCEENDIGLNGGQVDLNSFTGCNGFGEQSGVGVVFVETQRAFFKRNQTGGRENAGLAHAATQGFTKDSSAIDRCASTNEDRSDRRAEALRQAEVYGVEAASEFGDADAERDGGIEDAGAVEVGGQAGCDGSFPNLFVDRKWGDGAAGHVVRVFKTDETGRCVIVKLRRNGTAYLLPGEDAALSSNGARQAAGEGGHHRHLPIEYMGAGFADDFLTVIGMEANRNLVAHGSGWNENGGLTAEDFRSARFEEINGWIFTIDIVAYFSRSHGGTHCLGGACDGVASKVDDV